MNGTSGVPDTTPPTAPGPLVVGSTTQTSITLSWSASSDNVAVTGYTIYKNGVATGSTTATNASVAGLTCGTSYTLAVDAYDAAGNHSTAGHSRVSTLAAPARHPGSDRPGGPLPRPRPAPSTHHLSWTAPPTTPASPGTAATKNRTLAGATGTSYSYTGLSCGTSYTLAVDAYDAAGNRSAKAPLTASTAPVRRRRRSASVFIVAFGLGYERLHAGAPVPLFDRAYRVATAGCDRRGRGRLLPGPRRSTRTPPRPRPATSCSGPRAGAAVTVTGELEANAAHFELRDMTITEVNFPRSADDITLRNVDQPRLLDARPLEHLVHRRRDQLRRLRLPLAHPKRRRRLRTATQHPLRRRLLPRLALRLRRAHRVPADPRRRQRHDPQLDLQKLRHRQRRPRRHRRPLRRLASAAPARSPRTSCSRTTSSTPPATPTRSR